VSPSAYLCVLAAGAAVVAIWIHVRFPRLGPESFTGTLVCAGVALLGMNLSGSFAVQLIGGASRTTLPFTLVCFVFLPLVVLLLTVIWIMRAATTMGPGVR